MPVGRASPAPTLHILKAVCWLHGKKKKVKIVLSILIHRLIWGMPAILTFLCGNRVSLRLLVSLLQVAQVCGSDSYEVGGFCCHRERTAVFRRGPGGSGWGPYKLATLGPSVSPYLYEF